MRKANIKQVKREKGFGFSPSGSVSHTSSSAFTLIELLVAMTVLILLSTILFSMVDSATRMWRDSESRVESYREARAAVNLFARDLNNSIVTSNTNWFSADTEGTSKNPGHIAFLTALSPKAQRTEDLSDICAVGYALEWDNPNPLNPGAPARYSLYRYLRFSNPTFSDYLANSNTSVANIFANPPPAGTVRELLARNIANVKTTLYYTNAGGNLTTNAATPNDIPVMVEYTVTAVNEKAAARFGDNPNFWKDTNSAVFKENSQSFTTRIPVQKRKP